MPFRGFRRYSFSRPSIRQNAPSAPGVYGISNASEWIFVGSGADVQSALLDHLTASGTPLLAHAPTGFTFEDCAAGALESRQDSLIAELRPSCNSK
jgi:hypothetical protein